MEEIYLELGKSLLIKCIVVYLGWRIFEEGNEDGSDDGEKDFKTCLPRDSPFIVQVNTSQCSSAESCRHAV